MDPYAEGAHAPYLPEAWDLSSESGLAALDGEIFRQAQAIGFTNDFHAIAIAALATIPLIALLRTAGPPNRRRRARA